MRKHYCSLFAALAVAFSENSRAADVIGGPITNTASGSVYYLLSESTWEAAEFAAEELGGHLATINSKVEHDWVFETFGRFGGDTNRSLWIGLHKLNGAWVWASGEIAPFTYWAPGEPNNAGGTEDAASIDFWRWNPPGQWNDAKSSLSRTASSQRTVLYQGLVEVLPTSITPTIYTDDFEQSVGPEWSLSTRSVTPSGRTFLGEFSNQSVTLTLTNLTTHTNVTISFDLFIIESWDGSITNNPDGALVGPDVWDLGVTDGPLLLRTTFSNNASEAWKRQAYPDGFPGQEHLPGTGAVGRNTLGYHKHGDSIYRLSFTLPHSASRVEFEFSASGLQSPVDESWGLDNVQVALGGVPVEAPPQITGQPRSVTAAAGSAVTLEVGTLPGPATEYKWFHNDVSIPGISKARLHLASVTTADAGFYTVRVTNNQGSVDSRAAALTVVTGPDNQVVGEGASVQLAVTASGPAALAYQWGINGVDLPGATTACLELSSITLAQTANYSVRVLAPDRELLLPPAKVTVLPFGFTRAYGADFNGTVGAEWGAAPLAVSPNGQRRFLGQLGNDTILLALTNLLPHTEVCLSLDLLLTSSWDGNHGFNGPDVWGVRAVGGETVLAATFSTMGPAYSGDFPQSFPDAVGGGQYPAQTGATETETLDYNICCGFEDTVHTLTLHLPHASETLELELYAQTPLSDSETWGIDNVVVSTASLPPYAAPILTALPCSHVVCSAVPWWEHLPTAVFTVSAAPGGSVAYAWKYNGAAVLNATNASLVRIDVTAPDAGVYTVEVSNPNGTTSRGRALLGVVTAVPVSKTVDAGGTAVFEVEVAGEGLRYQWRHNGQDLPGETNAVLTLSDVNRDDAGDYTVIVENGGVPWVSPPAALAVPTIGFPGALVWEFQAGQIFASTPAIGSDGTIYAAANGILYAVTAAGAKRWDLPIPGLIYCTPAVGKDGTIYAVASSPPTLWAVTPQGNRLWELPLPGSFTACSPAIAADGTLCIGMETTDINGPTPFWAVNPNGTRKWGYVADSRATSDAAIGADGRIYFGCESGNVYALNPDGTLLWLYGARSAVVSSPAIDGDGTIYFGCADGALYAVGHDGGQHWRFQTAGGIASSPAIGRDGLIYFGSTDGHLYCLNRIGSIIWHHDIGVIIHSSPAVSASGTAYLRAADNDLYAVGPGGSRLWRFATGADWYHPQEARRSQPVLAQDGTIYIGVERSGGGSLFAITGDGPPADSPWPMFRHDARHTGRSPLRVVPQSLSVSLGANITFTNITSESAPTTYQWLFEGKVLDGATNSTLTLLGAQAAQAGHYDLLVNQFGVGTTYTGFSMAVDSTFSKVMTGPVGTSGGDSVGVAWGDFDDDGWQDLFVANGSIEDDFLYRNNGDGTFSRTASGTVTDEGLTTTAAAWADYDNDGNLDLFCAIFDDAGNRLYHNLGTLGSFRLADGSFTTDGGYSTGAAWGDYDNDGNLDLFVSNHQNQKNYLYHSNGDGTFARVTAGSVVGENGYSSAGTWADYDNDGDTDLFVARFGSGERNQLFRNDGGKGFTKITTGPVVNDAGGSGGGSWGDYDNDGDLDLFVTFIVEPDALYRNHGDGTFSRADAGQLGVDDGRSSASAWGDYDNDGYLDIFVANREGWNNVLYHNEGDGTFRKITSGSLANDGGGSWSAAWGDYDNDGALDLVVGNREGQDDFLYHNSGNANHWLKLSLTGTLSNASAIGAKVRAGTTQGGRTMWQLREISGGTGEGSQNALDVHFGLGSSDLVDVLRIEWPSGIVQEFENVSADQFMTIYEPPVLEVGQRQEDGSFEIILTSRGGFEYEIQASEDFIFWSTVGAFTNVNGSVQVVDEAAGPYPHRFYRAVMVP